MSSNPVDRRRFLEFAAVGASGLAGCLGESGGLPGQLGGGSDRSTPTSTPTPEPPPSASTAGWDTGLGRPVEWFPSADRWQGDDDTTTVALDDGGGTAESPRPFRGEYSLRVEGTGRVGIGGDFSDDPLDITGRAPSLAVRSGGPEATPSLYVTCEAPDGDNWVRFAGSYYGDRAFGWTRKDLPLADIGGSPILSDVRRVRVHTGKGGALKGEDTRLWVDDLRLLPRPERGKVMLMFDDIRTSQYANGFPVMQEYDVPAGFAVIVNAVGRTITLDQLHEMERAESDLVSHSMSGETMPELDRETRRSYLEESRAWLREHALRPEGADQFVFPSSAYDEESLADVRDVYDYAYVGGKGSAVGVTDPRTVTRVSFERNSLDALTAHLERAAAHGNLFVPFLHDVTDENVEKFRSFCRAIDDARDEVDVITPTDLPGIQADLAERER